MRQPLLLAVVSAFLILLFAACSPAATPTVPPADTSTDTSTDDVAEPTTAPAEEPTEAAPTEAAADTSGETASSGEPVTIDWWHISTETDDTAAWQELADAYTAEHPNVTINITVLENEAFKSNLTTAMQAGDPPDLFQAWGGGVLWEYANAGLVRNIAPELEGEWKDSFAIPSAVELYGQNGEYYGVPWRWGAVGLYYNKDLFEQAGLDTETCPATWTDFLSTVETLKGADITPIALGEGDKWPGHFWWVYLAMRNGGEQAFLDAYNRTGSFADAPFVKAGADLQQLIAMDPYPDGYLGMSFGDESTVFGNGEAAMELMGHWGPGNAAFNSESGEGVTNLGWCPFPAVEGGAGQPTDVLGGGDGFAVGVNAPDETVDFLRYLTSLESQTKIIEEADMGPGVVKGTEDLISSDWLRQVVEARDGATYAQLYYDQFLPPAVGGTVNDAVEQLYAEAATPEEAAQMIEDVAATELQK